MSKKAFLPAIIVAVLVVIAAAMLWRTYGPIRVEVVRPSRGPAIEAVYASGVVEPTVMIPIAPKIAGHIEELAVDERDSVTKGQVLAKLHSSELTALVSEAEARLSFAEAQYERARALRERGTGTGEALDRSRNDMETARAGLERASDRITEMTLKSPDAGTVIRREGEVGQLIQPGEAIFWLSCCSDLRVAAEVDEEDIPLVQPGLPVLIRADAFPGQVLHGTVSEITPKGDPVARSFRVRIALLEDTPLMIGMTADCNIIAGEQADALLVPSSALVDGKVWRIKDGRLEERTVTIGAAGNDRTEIKSGIDDGDIVVVAPDDRLKAGRRAIEALPE